MKKTKNIIQTVALFTLLSPTVLGTVQIVGAQQSTPSINQQNTQTLVSASSLGLNSTLSQNVIEDPVDWIFDEALGFISAIAWPFVAHTYRDQARGNLDALTYLGNNIRNKYLTQIAAASSAQELQEIIREAYGLNTAIEEAQNEIKNFTHLTAPEVTTYLHQLDNATTISEVEDIAEAASLRNEEGEGTTLLENVQAVALDTINDLEYLTGTEISNYNDRINAAQDENAISDILDEAIAKNDDEESAKLFNDYKTEALTHINALSHLLYTDKEDYISQLNGTTTTQGVTDVLAAAEQADGEAAQKEIDIQEAQNDAKATLDSFDKLTQQQKEDYETKIDAATDFAGVQAVLLEAADINTALTEDEKEIQDLADSKVLATTTLSSMSGLTANEMADYKKQIDEATNFKEVLQIIINAEVANTKARVATAITDAIANTTSGDLTEMKLSLINELKNLKGYEELGLSSLTEKILEATSEDQFDELANEVISELASRAEGDLNGDGVVNLDDLTYLQELEEGE